MTSFTRKQAETLDRVVQYEINHGGIGPTIAELQRLLNLKTPQAVISRMKTIEGRGGVTSSGSPIRFNSTPPTDEDLRSHPRLQRSRPIERFPGILHKYGPNDFFRREGRMVEKLLVPDVSSTDITELNRAYIVPPERSPKEAIAGRELEKAWIQNETGGELEGLLGLEIPMTQSLLAGRDVIAFIGKPGRGKSSFVRIFFESRIKDIPSLRHYLPVIFDAKGKVSIHFYPDYRGFVRSLLPKIESSLFSAFQGVGTTLSEFCRYVAESLTYEVTDIVKDPTRPTRSELEAWALRRFPDDPVQLSVMLNRFLAKRGDRRKRLLVIFDNVDQLPELTQAFILKFASLFSSEAAAQCVLVMRPINYSALLQSLESNPTQGLPPAGTFIFDVVEATTPSLEQIIHRRLKLLHDYLGQRVDIPVGAVHVSVRASQLLNSVSSTLSQPVVAQFLNELSGGDIKMSMMIAARFFSSGFLDSELFAKKVLMEALDMPPIPPPAGSVDKLLKFTTLNNRNMYIDTHSERFIENLFNCCGAVSLHPSVVKYYLLRLLSHSGRRLRRSQVEEELEFLGIARVVTKECINRFIERELVYCVRGGFWKSAGNVEIADEQIDIEISDRGRFYIDELCYNLEYLQHMADDTPYLSRLADQYQSNSIHSLESRLGNTLLLVTQVHIDDRGLRKTLKGLSHGHYLRFINLFGREILSVRMLRGILKNSLWSMEDSEFSRRHNLNQWKNRIERMISAYEREAEKEEDKNGQ